MLLGVAAAAGANYLPKMTGQSNITAVQAAFGVTHGGIITEAEFDIGKRGSRYEFEILSGGRKYEVNVDAMSGKGWVDEDGWGSLKSNPFRKKPFGIAPNGFVFQAAFYNAASRALP